MDEMSMQERSSFAIMDELIDLTQDSADSEDNW